MRAHAGGVIVSYARFVPMLVAVASMPFLGLSDLMRAPHDGDAEGKCEIEVRQVAVLGSVDDSVSLTQATYPAVGALANGAGWVVVDGEASFVLEYSPEGELRGRLVRSGQGPGEIESPSRAVLDPTDSLWITQTNRALIVGPDRGVRTLTKPGIVSVDGHTPAGLFYSVQVSIELTEDAGTSGPQHLHAIVMDRDGKELFRAGPAEAVPPHRRMPRSISLGSRYSLVSETDSTFLAPSGRGETDVWLARWTPAGVEPLLDEHAAWERLDLGPAFPRPLTGHTRHIQRAPDGAAWLLGSVRAMTGEQEEERRREVSAELGVEPRDFTMVNHPGLSNRAFPGVILRVTPDGELSAADLIEGNPRGFVDERHFFTLRVGESGLLQVVIWQFDWRCD